MPRYTYKCKNKKCEYFDVVIEQSRSVDDRNKDELCECGGVLSRVQEMTSEPILRGEGFTPKFHK